MTSNQIPSGFQPTGGQQQTLTLIQPIQQVSPGAGTTFNQIVAPGSNMTINEATTHIQPTIIQPNPNLGNVVPAQMVLSNNGATSVTNPTQQTQQTTQYVVQNVGTPVSFVQSKLKCLNIN